MSAHTGAEWSMMTSRLDEVEGASARGYRWAMPGMLEGATSGRVEADEGTTGGVVKTDDEAATSGRNYDLGELNHMLGQRLVLGDSLLAAYELMGGAGASGWDGGGELTEGLRCHAEHLLEVARSETFESGQDSSLGLGIEALVEAFGTVALEAVNQAIHTDDVRDVRAVREVMRAVGEMRDRATHAARRGLLESCLKSDSGKIRDGAAMGLEFLRDPEAVAALRDAAAKETRSHLRKYMLEVVDFLERIRTKRCP